MARIVDGADDISRLCPLQLVQADIVLAYEREALHAESQRLQHQQLVDHPVGEERYRELVAEVFSTDARAKQPASERIVIPGYPGLRSFSKDHEMLFKEALNQRWLAYFQKGNWRMIFPFWRNQQRATAEGLVSDLDRGELAVLHAVRFPNIEINPTVLLFGVEETPEEIRFRFYDPNEAVHPRVLVYDRARRTFYYPKTFYFAGGPIRAYEVYDGAIY